MVSVIIPAYNEEKRITGTLTAIEKTLRQAHVDFEILVVNDGSTDKTTEVVKQLVNGRIRLLSYKENRGKGGAVKYGIRHAAGHYIVFTDADLAYAPENIQRACQMLEKGCDVVLGSRVQSGSGKKYPWYRTVMSKGFGLLTGAVLQLRVRDTQCGFKAFRYEAAQEIFKRVLLSGWGFDAEAIFIAQKLGYKTERLQVELFHENKTSKIHVLRDAVKMANEVFEIKENNKLGRYE